MTRKDYVAVACALVALREDLPTDDLTDAGLDTVCEALARVFGADNPRFDRARFLAACAC